MENTRLTLGGFTQTRHVMELLSNQSRIHSGFLARFTFWQAQPTYTPLIDLKPINSDYTDRIMDTLDSIVYSFDPLEINNLTLTRTSPAFELFNSFYTNNNELVLKNADRMELQNQSAIVGKDVGKVLRVAAILHAFFVAWNVNEVRVREIEISQITNTTPVDIFTFNSHISAMSMEVAIDFVTKATNQTLCLAGLSLAATDGESLSREDENTTSLNKRTGPKTLIGRILTKGGKTQHVKRLNQDKILGRQGQTTTHSIMEKFEEMEGLGFGENHGTSFAIHPALVNMVRQDEVLRKKLSEQFVSVAELQAALDQPIQEPRQILGKRKSENLNITPNYNLFQVFAKDEADMVDFKM